MSPVTNRSACAASAAAITGASSASGKSGGGSQVPFAISRALVIVARGIEGGFSGLELVAQGAQHFVANRRAQHQFEACMSMVLQCMAQQISA
ncbi:MAG: hypothetical protein IPG63_09350 [Xanthomonadales bacterium]|nr:hypothetical protein [Xanthomonadales bacterium]